MRTLLALSMLFLYASLSGLPSCSDGGLECPDGEIVDGVCLPYDCPMRDCPEGFVCLDGQCAELACLDVECPEGQACAGGDCHPEDCQWRNCPGLGEVCIEEDCIPPGCAGVTCPAGERCAAGQCYPEDCETKLCPGYDEVCVEDECTPASCVGVECPEGELCAGGRCYPASCEELGCFSDNEVCIDDECVLRDCALVECADGRRCANGWCYDPDCPEEDCAEVEVCVDGECVQAACVGVECEPGYRCARGECLPIDCIDHACGDEEVCVDDQCVHVNCVGVVCEPGLECVDGQCLVPSCNGVQCDPGEECVDDACRCGGSGPDCDGDRASTCCGTDCVDLDGDPEHCDACGRACDEPPGDFCDEDTWVTFPPIGDCISGACEYAEIREHCENGCEAGTGCICTCEGKICGEDDGCGQICEPGSGCSDPVCSQEGELCLGNCRECDQALECTYDNDERCSGDCAVCEEGYCAADNSLCTGVCEICVGSDTRFHCEQEAEPNTAPTAVTPSTDPICTGSSTTLSASGGTLGDGASYQWFTGSCGVAAVSDCSGATCEVSPSATTSYFVRRAGGTCGVTTPCASGTVTVSPASAGGSISGGMTPICLGSSTGTMTLGGHTGAVVRWERRLDGGSWEHVANTTATHSETPPSAGTWDYRARVQSSPCAAVYS
ncbi:MAG: hypothetical protein JXR96_04480, partial [Deltaproteobacteria bacterium]|nr:hypothetical protein [Deltaproteobacteria bacterium]